MTSQSDSSLATTNTTSSNSTASSYSASSRYHQLSTRKKSLSASSSSFITGAAAADEAHRGGGGGEGNDRVGDDYTVADVYDDAAVIGSELEKIINNYGSEVLKDLMPKVISVLELLESLTIRKESESDEIAELRMRVTSLEMEKAQRMNEREKFETELVEIEDKWKQESIKLISMVNKLKEENKRLNDSLDENSHNSRYNDHLGMHILFPYKVDQVTFLYDAASLFFQICCAC
jgi:hypothetical protein